MKQSRYAQQIAQQSFGTGFIDSFLPASRCRARNGSFHQNRLPGLRRASFKQGHAFNSRPTIAPSFFGAILLVNLRKGWITDLSGHLAHERIKISGLWCRLSAFQVRFRLHTLGADLLMFTHVRPNLIVLSFLSLNRWVPSGHAKTSGTRIRCREPLVPPTPQGPAV